MEFQKILDGPKREMRFMTIATGHYFPSYPILSGGGPFGNVYVGYGVRIGNTPLFKTLKLVFPLWIPLLLFATYPTLAFIRGPVRRWRRQRKGWCPACGYDLQGNVSGVCPECGVAP